MHAMSLLASASGSDDPWVLNTSRSHENGGVKIDRGREQHEPRRRGARMGHIDAEEHKAILRLSKGKHKSYGRIT